MICTDGEGLHEVDFSPIALLPRRVIHVRPGQVHRWRLTHPYKATLAFIPDAPHLRGSGWPVGPRWFDLDDNEWTQTTAVLDLMQQEVKLRRPPERRDLALRAALELLIVNLGIDLPRQQATGHLPTPYVELLHQIETDPDWSRSVTERTRRLGYSQRTLTRACIAATGCTAKQIIDDRILLEAQRLLIDGNTPISSVAREMGFTEPANFTRFFHRLTGDNPATWLQHTRPHHQLQAPGAPRSAVDEME